MVEFPDKGYVFWAVGNGDSTTVVVDSETIIQLDLNHCSEAGEDPTRLPIIDDLVANLPDRAGKNYLAVFGLSHGDEDHCRGFKRLHEDENVLIGDLWFGPRILTARDELCDDAKAFKAEAERRIEVNRKGKADSGDRIRIIGDADTLAEYADLSDECFTRPGEWFSAIDGVDREGEFHAFVHAPLKEDAEREENATSIAMKITVYDGEAAARAIVFGDLHNPTLKRVFDEGDVDSLEWNIFLAPHHCSDSIMFVEPEGGGDRLLDKEIMEQFERAGTSPTFIVSSSTAFPSANKDGDNPPHIRARQEYEKIAERFEVTGEWPNAEKPEAMVFEFVDGQLTLREPSGEKTAVAIAAATAGARGDQQTPTQRHGYGASA
jgi:hypothetical protein